MQKNFEIPFGSDLVPQISGTSNIGEPSLPFANIYANELNVNGLTNVAWSFSEIPNGLINNSNKTFTFQASPVKNSLELFLNGILVNQSGSTSDYSLSGNTISMFYAPESGSSLIGTYLYSLPSGIPYGTFFGTLSGISGPSSTTQSSIVLWNNTTGTAVANSNLISDSNGDLLASNSGTQNIGSFNTPFNNIYAKSFINANSPSYYSWTTATSVSAHDTLLLSGTTATLGNAFTPTNTSSGTFIKINQDGIYSSNLYYSSSTTSTNFIIFMQLNANTNIQTNLTATSGTLGLTSMNMSVTPNTMPLNWTGYLVSGSSITYNTNGNFNSASFINSNFSQIVPFV